MKKLITLIALLMAVPAFGQIVYVTDLDLTQEWIWTSQQGPNKVTENLEVGQVTARYMPVVGWQLQQSADLVTWYNVWPKYAIVDGNWMVGVFTIIVPNAQFFRYNDDPPKKNPK